MPTVKLSDIGIYYETHGKGEPLVLIMGFTGTTEVWDCQIPDLSREYRVVAFDNRGSGRSDKPDIPYTMPMLAQDTAELLDALGIVTCHVYGVSMGGMIAQEFAIRCPERVISLALGCTSCGGEHFILPDEETMAFLLGMEHRGQLTPEEMVRESLPFAFTQGFIDNNSDMVEQYVSMQMEHWPPPHSFMRQVEAMMTHDTYDRLPQIKAPTLVISGGVDRQVPVENARVLASRIPDAELVILQNIGHAFFIEAAEQANEVILDFLGRHPIAARQPEAHLIGR
jgi:pimeloyl-ACP methyl ester carboxylesterase